MDIKIKGIDELIVKLNPKVAKQAVNRTINELGSKTRTFLVKEVRLNYNISAKDLKQFIKIKKSRYADLSYVMDIRSSSFNAKRFNAKKLKAKGKMSVLIKKTDGRKVFKKGTFVAKNGAVLQRKGNTQEIEGVKTVSIPQMFNEKTLQKADKLIENEHERIFKNNFNFYIGKE
ncbi:MAG: hypothetical protein PHG81_05640 [Aliarcobacter sp.]|nr:hypothetical protein [Aliarcobacter sp.]